MSLSEFTCIVLGCSVAELLAAGEEARVAKEGS